MTAAGFVTISRITLLPLVFAFPAGIAVSCAFPTTSDKSPGAVVAFPLYRRGISDINSRLFTDFELDIDLVDLGAWL